MSFTQWFTRSSPTVPCRPVRTATFIFVPPPSARRTHQPRLAIPRQFVHRAEAADLGQHPRRKRLARKLLDGGDGAIGLVDIHARVAVANWCFSGQIPVYGVASQPCSVAFQAAM